MDKDSKTYSYVPSKTHFNSSAAQFDAAIAEYNKQLKEFCSTKPNVKILDATTGFIDSKGYLKNTSDGLHINESKNATFYKNIFNAIKKSAKK